MNQANILWSCKRKRKTNIRIEDIKNEMKQITSKLIKTPLTDRESELMMFYQSHGEEQGAIEYVKNKLNKQIYHEKKAQR